MICAKEITPKHISFQSGYLVALTRPRCSVWLYTAFAFIRLFLNIRLIHLLHLGHFIISSASFADTKSINLLLEQTGHLTFTAIGHHLLLLRHIRHLA
jgi:hypothetical protein